MRKALLVTFVLLVLISSVALAQDTCFVVKTHEWGEFCEGDPDSLRLTVTNTCETPYVLSICMEQKEGKWECFLTDNFEPGTEKAYGICNATGNFKLAQCYRLRNCNALEETP